MSVPPLVCSTPPPPDHVDEIVYNDEFSLDYEDSSPSHQYESRGYSFNDPPSVKETTPDNSTPSPYLSSPTEKVITFQNKKDESKEDEIDSEKEEPTAVLEKLSNQADITPQDEYKVNDISNHIIEDNSIEDLDLKLDSLQLDFQNAKESIEDTLNSTFDDFGTFLSTNVPNDSLENSIYLPIPGLTENKSEKPQKLHEISSDGSFTPPNGDNSDSEIGWENVPDSLNENTDLDISTEVPDIFFDTNVVYPDADKDLPDNVTNDIQDNINDTCQTLTDSSISNNDEFSIDTHFEAINSVSGDKNLESGEQISEQSHAEVTAEIFDNNDKHTEPETNKLSLENLDTLIDEPPQCVDVVSDAFSSFSVASDIPINIDPHSVIEKHDVCVDKPEDLKTSADDDFDFDDFATFENTDTNLFPDDIGNDSFTFNIEQLKTNDCDIISDGDKSILKNDSAGDCASQSDNDDFGDFDTYDPSFEPVKKETAETPSVSSSGTMHMAEFGNSNDTEIYEKLCSVVNEIFPDVSFDSDSCEDCELNTVLGENWKHLKDYETEQSYLFQWNNSASQKSLLKSLGIDSRNILFGPKWNTNMPRFAANLGVSPLQPIRQISNMNAMSDYRTDERLPNDDENPAPIGSDCKENDWENATSLSTTDLQASSYAESLLLDLEHLMATLDQMTSGQSAHFKISDLFTNAIERGEEHTNIPHSCEHVTAPEQPNKPVKTPAHPTMLNIGRQINLPETHIFTPTDSETPWSHTIHYNDTDKTLTPSSKTDDINIRNTLSKSETFDDMQQDAFEDFSDFKSHSGFDPIAKPLGNPDSSQYDFDFALNGKVHDITLSNDFKELPKQTLPFVESGSKEIDDFGDFHSAEALRQVSQTPPSIPVAQPLHVLEPVKVIPSIPVVNWPAPGDIKSSAFEEFTDIPAVPPLQPIWDDTQTFPPAKLFSSAPTFILKESKITSECFVSDVPPEIPKLKTNKQSSEFDEFSEFQSVAEASSKIQPLGYGTSYIGQTFNKEPTSISNIDLNKNISFETKSMSAGNDDFDDFQSVEYNSTSTIPKDTPKYTYTVQSFPRQEFVPKYQNNFQPTGTKTSSTKPLGFPVEQYSRTPLQPVSVQQTDDYATKNASHQILQPLSLESYSQINWPDPGIDLQDLSRFNPINSIQSYTEPKETKNNNSHGNSQDDDGWSDFVSIKPVGQNVSKTTGFNAISNNHPSAANVSMEDSEDWSDFVSNTVLPSRNYNEVKTISQNIHSQANSAAPYKYKGGGNTNLNPSTPKTPEMPPSVSVLPHLSYSTSKTSVSRKYNNHFQNL